MGKLFGACAVEYFSKMSAEQAAAKKERPRSAYEGGRPPTNEKWGAIVETNRGFGHQRRSRDDVDAMVERLSAVPGEMKVPDSQRTGALKHSGIMNSYAWKGY